ncbi:hypothetical protein [Streptomyces sp. NPDC048172]|uniref:hypothetical protein n=1 Tax=Streptomyces sp. NPDC048172 TaxID=3365505 RepID=UPI003713F3A9
MNLVLTIFALVLALSLAVLVVTWCTVLAALREGLADEDEPHGDSGRDGGERAEAMAGSGRYTSGR